MLEEDAVLEAEEEVAGERAKDWCSGGRVVVARRRRCCCCVWWGGWGCGDDEKADGGVGVWVVDVKGVHRRGIVKSTAAQQGEGPGRLLSQG